jgi:competence protein ComEA
LAVAATTAALILAWRASREPDLVLKIEPIGPGSDVTVYVGGAVANPGLYTLPAHARVAQAVEQAGPLENADTSSISMAVTLKDGQQVYVPRGAGRSVTSTEPAPAPASVVAALASPPASGHRIINVNSAPASELEALPGIGPALAARIIEYRDTYGPFESLDALADVRGISPRMIDEFRSMATTGP